ncbi:helix-turn-helix domain-containing protein [Chelativorans sp. AA-79]|uniref:IclR family transcriptional regulator n=1 Tax=Chelativorans sp. AA-79 TaxID=3028735 RepID=UPI0023F81D0B|nr:helix-turn-helix domain-containing protein [Chelativorans sp. AA-79]WEX10767.1 helix-turn-helix domain-containing protein [Chelativorans sp. AA-79]
MTNATKVQELDDGKSVESASDRSVSQTLSRGLQVLEVLAENGQPMTAQQIAKRLGLTRPIVYRLLKTLEQHQLLGSHRRDGYFELGLGLLNLTRNVKRDMRQAAFPIIRDLAEQVGTTAVLGLSDHGEIVYVLTVEAELARMAVRSREGTRRPMDSTSGLALRMTWAPRADDDEELVHARQRGFAARDRVMGYQATAISAPVRDGRGPSRACVTVLFPNVIEDVDAKGPLVVEAARRIAATVPLEPGA